MLKYLTLPFICLCTYIGYIALILIIDFRIERLRQPISDNALRVAADTAIIEWQSKYRHNETLLEKKRNVRDKKLKEWSVKLNKIIEME